MAEEPQGDVIPLPHLSATNTNELLVAKLSQNIIYVKANLL